MSVCAVLVLTSGGDGAMNPCGQASCICHVAPAADWSRHVALSWLSLQCLVVEDIKL